MTKPLTGSEPAYPSETTLAAQIGGMNGPITRPGISIRLHLAAMFHAALLGRPMMFIGVTEDTEAFDKLRAKMASDSLRNADALIAAYNKEPAHD